MFFVVSFLNRAYVRNKVENLVQEQLQATAEILKVNIAHFLRENYPPDRILKLYSQEKNIYYMALLDENKEILSWTSLFEGYLPLSLHKVEDKQSWIIDSPAGKIYNFFSSFFPEEGKVYYIYLGYTLKNLEEMSARSRQNFFLTFGLIVVIGIVFFMGLYGLQRHYLEKEKEAEKEKREKERYREISALTSGVAHEIKNPLNSLSLLFELFQRKAPAQLQEDVSLGNLEVKKISRIVDQFSNVLRPLKLEKSRFNFEDLVASARASLLRQAEKKDVEIQYSQTSPLWLEADKALVGQVIFNILKNALEATQAGIISVLARKHKKKVLIEIEDKGSGIPEEDRERVFEPFFSGKKEGMGIGLYLAKKIIEAHEGKIGLKSELGRGTRIIIEIPGD